MEPFRSGGSGVVVDAEKGIILSKHRVIVDAKQIAILFSDAGPLRRD
jgi:S1-C subfamily serine protease